MSKESSIRVLALAMPAMLALSASGFVHEAAGINLYPIATDFKAPIGIDHHEPTNQVVLSVNYPSGVPLNFELVAADGSHAPFSTASGFTDEIKLCTAREDGNGFFSGELFCGNGTGGVVVRISADGSSVQNPWVNLPGETGLPRGGLHVDRTGVFGGDLIVVTTAGGVWRITGAGVATPIVNVGTHLEGVTTVPDDVDQYGPWAGKILAGAEGQGLLYAVAPDGSFTTYGLGISPEDVDIIPANERFYGVAFAEGAIYGADASDFAGMVGDVLVTQESPGNLYHVSWNGNTGGFDVELIGQVVQWEHVTFSPADLPTPVRRASWGIIKESFR